MSEESKVFTVRLVDGEAVELPDGGTATPEEEARYADLTAELADRRPRRGRPTLGGGRAPSPRVSIRIPDQWGAALDERAEREHVDRSTVVRRAVAQYLGVDA